MSEEPIEHFVENGYTVSIYYDPHCSNPHEDDVHFKLLELRREGKRNDGMGDETIDMDTMELPCVKCGGSGYVVDAEGEDEECGCWESTRTVESLPEVIEWVKREYKAIVAVPVVRWEQSSVIYKRVGEDYGMAWGVMIYTPEMRLMWGVESDEDDILCQMDADLAEYSDWASGWCRGYVIRDRNGDKVESCWGYIGSDEKGELWAAREGRSEAKALPPQPPKLYDVPRMTEAELRHLLACLDVSDAALGAGMDDVRDKLMEAVPWTWGGR